MNIVYHIITKKHSTKFQGFSFLITAENNKNNLQIPSGHECMTHVFCSSVNMLQLSCHILDIQDIHHWLWMWPPEWQACQKKAKIQLTNEHRKLEKPWLKSQFQSIMFNCVNQKIIPPCQLVIFSITKTFYTVQTKCSTVLPGSQVFLSVIKGLCPLPQEARGHGYFALSSLAT